MDWQGSLRALGLEVPVSPDFYAIVVAVLIVAGAYGLGRLIGLRAETRVAAALHRWTGRRDEGGAGLARALIHYGIMALLLLVADNAALLSPYGLIIVALALGCATARIVHALASTFALGQAGSMLLAAIALVATTAGTLGGMEPLLAALDRIGLTVGTHRLTLLGIVNFIVVASVLYVSARVANRVLVHSIERMRGLDISQRTLVQKLAGITVMIVAVLLGIDLLGIDLTALTVFSGALGLAVGFGLQKTFGNLIAGLILLMDRSVKPGDVIVVGDTFGTVGKIGVRAVSVLTRDGKEHLIPNEQLMTEAVENWSYSSRNVRIHIPVGVGYGSDLQLAQRLMIEAAIAAKRVLDEPRPSVWLKDFGENAVQHDIMVWIADPELGTGNVRSDVLNRLWILFRDNGIELPFPQRDIHVRSIAAMPAASDHPSGKAVPEDGQAGDT
ncbi:mechanosensitive ion channel family protein [Flavisphingomonas formosensis]|uniref:mechanosensitive ion channel family protein n=1 Tax=Flavisphingomonas formosensis TaxID=861534 RepID=UPI001E3AED85|nr:mechanosensitive ion channel domain-containing protein [Sphingomonas formosensis]